MTNQSDRQADARSSTGTALTYEGDSLAYFDSQSVAAGEYNGRLLAWINQALGTSYTEINGAKTALANNISIPTWDGLNLLGTAGTLPPPPGGLAFLLGNDGAYLTGSDGAYLLGLADGYNFLFGADSAILTGADGAYLLGVG